MPRTISIGAQGFAQLRENGYFYVDKTGFVRDWWRGADVVTLVCRPRRFGKTLNLDTVRCFLSTEFAGRGEELFGGLKVWDDPAMRKLQGTVPVVSLSFAAMKGPDFFAIRRMMCDELAQAWRLHAGELDAGALGDYERDLVLGKVTSLDPDRATGSVRRLCELLATRWGRRCVVLLDEYDTPMQEAWLCNEWDEAVGFQRALFNATFKTNPFLERGLITGVTRVSRESIFSDLNNLRVVTTLTDSYEEGFGFTEAEVLAALDEFGLSDQLDDVRRWYDGFTFGTTPHVYNPWSVTNYLEEGALRAYWANTSSNGLVSTLVKTGDVTIKEAFSTLLAGGTLRREIDEEIIFSRLAGSERAVWSLLLAAGYLRADNATIVDARTICDLALTNREVLVSFEDMVASWFDASEDSYNAFVRALLAGDVREMGAYLSDVALCCMSSFDSGTHPSGRARPERFWHGLVLGLLVELRGRYAVESNRESGYGRADVMLVPLGPDDPAIILEFKVVDAYDGESTLADAVASAHAQIEGRGYAAGLVERGVSFERIRSYGIAFEGKRVLVG